MSFDTSSLPDHCTITVLAISIRRRVDEPLGTPQDYILRFSLGTWIGATLDGNVGEWDGGTLRHTLYVDPPDKTIVNFSSAAHADINLSGDTDLKIWDDSFRGTGDVGCDTYFNKLTDARCRLFVTFAIPSAEATGKGYASASGEIVGHATAEVTGEGESAGTGMGVHSGSSSVTGSGSQTSKGTGVRVGIATATGVGDQTSVPWVIADATVTVTGVGYGTGSSEITARATATVTGVGYATGDGGIIQAPLAVHSTTISVSSSDSSTVSVGIVDCATISVDPEDSQTRNPRRLP